MKRLIVGAGGFGREVPELVALHDARRPTGLASTIEALDRLYEQLNLMDVDARRVRRAAELAHRHALRGYGAIHLAGAERVVSEVTILAVGGQPRRTAARNVRRATADTSVRDTDS